MVDARELFEERGRFLGGVLAVLVVEIDELVAMQAVEGQDDHHDEVRDEQRGVEPVPAVEMLEGMVAVVVTKVVAEVILRKKGMPGPALRSCCALPGRILRIRAGQGPPGEWCKRTLYGAGPHRQTGVEGKCWRISGAPAIFRPASRLQPCQIATHRARGIVSGFSLLRYQLVLLVIALVVRILFWAFHTPTRLSSNLIIHLRGRGRRHAAYPLRATAV